MKAAPAMPLFGDAYMADTRHLSLEEHGAYLSLLMIAWRTDGCRLPNDDRRLSQMLGITTKRWAKLKPAVMAFWTLTADGWEQKRLLKERRFVAKKSEQNAEAANARWNANSLNNNEPANANASVMQCERNAPPPSPTKERKEGGDKSPTSYAFFGQTIRLTPQHLERWRKTYSAIPDLEAELNTIDAWWQAQSESERKNWFYRTASMLNRKHQELLSAKSQDEDEWNMMP